MIGLIGKELWKVRDECGVKEYLIRGLKSL